MMIGIQSASPGYSSYKFCKLKIDKFVRIYIRNSALANLNDYSNKNEKIYYYKQKQVLSYK
jgi:hypothetical protein